MTLEDYKECNKCGYPCDDECQCDCDAPDNSVYFEEAEEHLGNSEYAKALSQWPDNKATFEKWLDSWREAVQSQVWGTDPPRSP